MLKDIILFHVRVSLIIVVREDYSMFHECPVQKHGFLGTLKYSFGGECVCTGVAACLVNPALPWSGWDSLPQNPACEKAGREDGSLDFIQWGFFTLSEL